MDALAATSLGEVVEGRQYVTFGLNNEEYAVDALNVQEIIEMASITHVPHLPEFFKGVINLRGTIIPVVDLKLKFGMASEGYRKHTCVIVTEFSGGVMGIIVDSVSDVMHMPKESVSATPSFGSQIRTDFIQGMGKVSDRLVLILDINKVLTEEEASIVNEQLTEAL
ncbi:MAG: chemotaxis protein CheW [Nitrospirae bacterium]|nr:chemotaxis protein CheW [Nitrospirota bacterium]MCL5977788.1 chemotaxis protein CheW [Nitrospirota bacterium]